MLSINIKVVSSLLNGVSRLRLELAIAKAKSLSLAQCIINGACRWLDHSSIFNLFLATISCASSGPYRFGPPTVYAPLLVPVPSSSIMDQFTIGNSNFIKPKYKNRDDSRIPVDQHNWDNHIGTRNRLIGGPGTLLISGSKKLLDPEQSSYGITIPTQVIPVEIPVLGWVKPYPYFTTDMGLTDVLINKLAPYVPSSQRHGYRIAPPKYMNIPSSGKPDWILQRNLDTHPISILQTKITYEWILQCSSDKNKIQQLITNRWIGMSAEPQPLAVPNSEAAHASPYIHKFPAPLVSLVDDSSTESGFRSLEDIQSSHLESYDFN